MKLRFRSIVSIVVPLWAVVLAGDLWADEYRITATLLTSAGPIQAGTVEILDSRFKSVGPARSGSPKAIVIKDAIVSPGLIDLHDHLSWNVLPAWRPGRLFSNRYQWQLQEGYARFLRTPNRDLMDHGFACATNRYAEFKAIVHGATSVLGSLPPSKYPELQKCLLGLARNLDFAPDLGADLPSPVQYEVFPFEDVPIDSWREITPLLATGKRVLAVHLAEGRRDDGAAQREFAILKKQKLLIPGLIIIHGTGLGSDDFHEMAAAGVGLVWSPRSNIALYGETTDVIAAKAGGVHIALAPDWSPTGSEGMLDELGYAKRWSEAHGGPFKDADLLAMATSVPASLSRLDREIGSLAPGKRADFIVVRSCKASDPYACVIQARARDVLLVVINGRAVFGSPDLLAKFPTAVKQEAIDICGERRAFVVDLDGPALTRKRLADRLSGQGLVAAPYASCE